jgi:eukaryotic-like serine/threonine-protein kinase
VEPELSAKSVHIVGRYALYDAIAAGGMATVHYGRLLGPVGFSRTVAIKRLHAQFARDPEFVSMFLDEARLAARIRHPNVVPTLDVVATGGELFLVMEYVPGESLARLIRTAAGLGTVVPPRIVVAIVCGVLRGLHAAHEATNERGEPLGIVHRDVSPQNVLVGIDGQARVLDFGVAKAAGRLQTTRDGKLKGKLAYMSPEQLRGKAIDRRTDIFAASTVLWEGLTGRRLFRGDNEGAIITQILEGNVSPPSSALTGDIDDATRATIRAVDDIVLKGLVTKLDERYETARAMAVALEKAVPPAGVSEVSDWVEHFAKDILITRAQVIADIESNSSVDAAGLRAIQESSHDLAAAAADASSRRGAPRLPETPSGVDETRSIPVDLSTISSVASQSRVSRASNRQRAQWIVIGATGLVGALLFFVLLRAIPSSTGAATGSSASSAGSGTSPPGGSVASTASGSPSAAPWAAASSAAPQPGALESGSGTTPGSASSVALTPGHPPVSAGNGPVWHPPTHPPPPHPQGGATPPSPPPPPHPVANCNPPFTYDGQGLKHFKPECL